MKEEFSNVFTQIDFDISLIIEGSPKQNLSTPHGLSITLKSFRINLQFFPRIMFHWKLTMMMKFLQNILTCSTMFMSFIFISYSNSATSISFWKSDKNCSHLRWSNSNLSYDSTPSLAFFTKKTNIQTL